MIEIQHVVLKTMCWENSNSEPWKCQEENGKKSVLFYYLDFQIVKVDCLNEIITRKTSLAETFEIRNVFIQPDRFSQIELVTDFFQRPEYLVGAGVIAVISNAGVLKHMIVFKYLSP